MSVYHFCLGDSSTGPIGFCSSVEAGAPEQAVARLREEIEALSREFCTPQDWLDTRGVYYIAFYFGDPAKFTAKGH